MSIVPNSNRNRQHRPLSLLERLNTRDGMALANGYRTTIDAYEYQTTCPKGGQKGFWNPVRQSLIDLGLMNNKAQGIPLQDMEANEDARLAVIAGLIDSDGCYNKTWG